MIIYTVIKPRLTWEIIKYQIFQNNLEKMVMQVLLDPNVRNT
jgi:hypothetical protein